MADLQHYESLASTCTEVPAELAGAAPPAPQLPLAAAAPPPAAAPHRHHYNTRSASGAARGGGPTHAAAAGGGSYHPYRAPALPTRAAHLAHGGATDAGHLPAPTHYPHPPRQHSHAAAAATYQQQQRRALPPRPPQWRLAAAADAAHLAPQQPVPLPPSYAAMPVLAPLHAAPPALLLQPWQQYRSVAPPPGFAQLLPLPQHAQQYHPAAQPLHQQLLAAQLQQLPGQRYGGWQPAAAPVPVPVPCFPIDSQEAETHQYMPGGHFM